jgi:hypothetical protein
MTVPPGPVLPPAAGGDPLVLVVDFILKPFDPGELPRLTAPALDRD